VFSVRSIHFAVRSLLLAACLPFFIFILAGCAGYTSINSAMQPAISLSASSIDFKTVAIGQTGTQTLHVSNSGTAPLQISQISLSSKLFAFSGPSVPRTVLPSQGLDYTLTFAPSAVGNANASISIASNAPQSTVSVSLAGVGEKVTAALQLTPTSLNFGNLLLNSTSTQNVTLQNTTTSKISISGVTVVGAGFGLSSLSPGFSLSPSQKLTFQVWFKPKVKGPSSGTVSILGASLASPASMSLAGDGVTSTSPTPSSHKVHLTWNPSSTPGVSYRVYRSEVSGSSYAALTTTITALNFDDSSVSPGLTYYYVVTAVDGSGDESIHSNEVAAAVPSP
jgi:hypothetical protein